MEQETTDYTSTRKPEITAPLLADGLCAAGKWRIGPDIMEKRGSCHD